MGAGHFQPLPRAETSGGAPRRIGVELEFGDLLAARAARIVRDRLGGEVARRSAEVYDVTGTGLGDFKVELDTALKDGEDEVQRISRDIARPLIPVEIVCPPVPVAGLPRIEALFGALADAGAAGTESGALRAYGMHFNVEAVSLDPGDLLPVLRAFAFLEDWLRSEAAINLSRRMLPFVDPYPRDFLDALAADDLPADTGGLAALYLRHNPTRNRALDMTPILMIEAEDQIVAALGKDHSVSARPTFHYRLPDSGIGVPGWSIAHEWNRWVLVERVAEDASLLAVMAADWRAHRDSWTSLRPDWLRQVARRLAEAGLAEGAAT